MANVTVQYRGDTWEAVNDEHRTYIYDSEGDILITYFMGAGNQIDENTLILILSAYFKGFEDGESAGKNKTQIQIRTVLGI